MPVHLQNNQVKFVYQGHWIKVKVTGAKACFLYPVREWSALGWKAILFLIYVMRRQHEKLERLLRSTLERYINRRLVFRAPYEFLLLLLLLYMHRLE